MKKSWEVIADEIENLELEITAQTGPTGKLFGSVTSSQIVKELELHISKTIDRKTIRIPSPIKQVGDYKIPIKLFQDVESEIQLKVISDGSILSDDVVEIVENLKESEAETQEAETQEAETQETETQEAETQEAQDPKANDDSKVETQEDNKKG